MQVLSAPLLFTLLIVVRILKMVHFMYKTCTETVARGNSNTFSIPNRHKSKDTRKKAHLHRCAMYRLFLVFIGCKTTLYFCQLFFYYVNHFRYSCFKVIESCGKGGTVRLCQNTYFCIISWQKILLVGKRRLLLLWHQTHLSCRIDWIIHCLLFIGGMSRHLFPLVSTKYTKRGHEHDANFEASIFSPIQIYSMNLDNIACDRVHTIVSENYFCNFYVGTIEHLHCTVKKSLTKYQYQIS